MSTADHAQASDIREALAESISIVGDDGSHRLAMLASAPGSHVVVWMYTLTADLVGTDDDTRHVFTSWDELRSYFVATSDAALISSLLARCGKATGAVA